MECQLFDWKKRNHKMGCKMQEICNEANAAYAARPCPRPPTDRCTGCNRRFREEDDGPCDECPDCGYLACESCASHHSRGGTFGRLYCQVAPRKCGNCGEVARMLKPESKIPAY